MMDISRIQKGFQTWYDREEATWTPIQPCPNAFSTTRYDDVARLLENQGGGNLLDVGCGSGQMTLAVADRFDHTVGFDITAWRIEQARKALQKHYAHLASKVEFHIGSADPPLPYKDASFDVVLGMSILQFVVDIFGLMEELARICKPGGIVILTMRNACYVQDVKDLLLGRLPNVWRCSAYHNVAAWRTLGGWEGGKLHLFNRPSINALLTLVGFTPEVWTGCGRWAKLRRRYLNLMRIITVRARRCS